MRLLTKTNLYFAIAALVVFTAGGILFFLLFQVIIDRDLNRKLQGRKAYVIEQLTRSDSLVFYQKFSSNTISIERITAAGHDAGEILSDTVLYDDVEHKSIGYRQLSFYSEVGSQKYRIHIRRMLVETKELIKGVIVLEAMLFLSFLAILSLLNSQLSRRIWRPFYAILETISQYKTDRAESLHFPRHSTTEFNELAIAIEKMSAKINQEFNNQKEFTENASHEIQTPLAIIKNKLEILLQTDGLSQSQIELISAAFLAANRLSKLNEALIILSRIENRQFHSIEKISVNQLIEQHLSNLEELIQMRKIKVKKNFLEPLSFKMNPFLAEMLLENLITNGIKHNHTPGFLSITTKKDALLVCNTGDSPLRTSESLFKRFAKGNNNSQSLGLGLPIIKAICDTYQIPVRYTFETGVHWIELKFESAA